MGRKPTKAKRQEQETNELLTKLEFISLVKTDETTALFRKGELIATNGVITIGVPITTDLTACPNLAQIVNALRICGQSYQLTQLTDGAIAIKGGTFKAKIPCVPPEMSPALNIFPDEKEFPLDPAFMFALGVVAPIPTEHESRRLVEISILCRNQTVVASDGHIVLEAWHGVSFPELVLPKAAATMLAKTKKDPKTFALGYTPEWKISSITFRFGDGSWLKSQVYIEAWPEIDHIFNMVCDVAPQPLSPTFFEVVDNVSKFVQPGKPIYLQQSRVMAAQNEDDSAMQVLDVATAITTAFNPHYMRFVAPYMNRLGYSTEGRALYFTGDRARAVLKIMR